MKIVSDFYAGASVWVVDPAVERIEVYEPGKQPLVLTTGDTLTGGDVLPGFTLAVQDIFPE